MMQRRGYWVSRYNSTIFKTFGHRQFKEALRGGHRKISAVEFKRLVAKNNLLEAQKGVLSGAVVA